MDFKTLASVFGLIFLVELPDKTVFATVLLASRRQHHAWGVFAGVAAAFAVQSLIGVAFGSVIGLLPPKLVQIVAGLMFLGFAADLWLRLPEKQEKSGDDAALAAPKFTRSAWAAFVVIFIAEWGDLSQLATAALAAKYRAPATVFLGATSALWSVTALAVLAGQRLKTYLDPRKLQRIAAVAFAVVGIGVLLR